MTIMKYVNFSVISACFLCLNISNVILVSLFKHKYHFAYPDNSRKTKQMKPSSLFGAKPCD